MAERPAASGIRPASRWFARFAVALVAMAGAAVAPTSPAAAGAPGSVELVSQSLSVAADGTFEVEVAVTGPAQATVEITVHPQVISRISFEATIETGPRGLPLYAARSEPIGQRRAIGLRVPVTDGVDADRLRLERDGVYPVEISLLDIDGTRIDRFVTHLVRVTETDPEVFPLAVALTLPLETGVALEPDGRRQLDPADAGAVEALTAGLGSQPGVPATVSVSPETTVALDQRARAELADAIEGRDLLARPYVDVDPTAWLDAGLDSELIDLLAVGPTTIAQTLGADVAPSLWLAEPTLTPAALATLGGLGLDTFVFPEEGLEPLDADRFPLSLTQQFLVEDANGRRYPAAAIDERLSRRFPRGADAALAAHHVLAELTVLATDQPAISRGVIMAPPADWVPDATFLRIVLGGVADNPRLEPVSLTGYFDTVSIAYEGGQNATLGFHLDRELMALVAEDLSEFADRYTSVAAGAFSFGGMLDEDAAISELSELLRVAGSSDLSPIERERYLDAAEATVEMASDAVVVRDTPERVTFAARDGDIPLIVENTLDVPVAVLVSLSSDKLEFPEGDSREVTLAPGRNELLVGVSARTSGDSILDVSFSSPDRAIDLGSTTVTVRSTAFSGAAVIIAVVALIILGVWWLRTRRSQHRDDRLVNLDPEVDGNVGEPERV